MFEGKAKTYTLSITYKNGTSTQTLDYSYAYGENYVIKTPEIAGKTADMTVVKGVVTGDVQEIVTYTDQAAWDGTVATAFAGGDGTQANPYKIATASQLAYLSKISKGTASSVFTYYGEGVYYELTANINLNNQPWTPIAHRGSTTNYNWRYFAGNFNGNGYTISGLSIKKSTFGVGLFESVSGTIENLNLVGEISVNHRAGALAYYLKSGTVRNIVSKVDITLTNTSTVYTGGIIGTASDSTLENCVNYGIVKSTGSRTGGVLGSLVLTS